MSSPQAALAGRLFELTIVLGELMERGLAERELTRARATVVSQLRARGPVMQRELSQALGVTPRNVTGLVDALEGAGLVMREPHPADRRATLVRLSDTGERLAARLHADEQRFGGMLFDGISETELDTFTVTLDRVLARLHSMRSSAWNSQAVDRAVEGAGPVGRYGGAVHGPGGGSG